MECHKIGKLIKNVNRIIFSKDIFFVLLLLATVFIMHALKEPTTIVERRLDLYLPIIHTCLDVSIVWMFCGVLTLFRRQLLYLLSFVITFCWSLANVIYSRFFGQYISLSVFGELSANMHGLWWVEYARTAFRPSDLIFVIIVLLFCLCYYMATQNSTKKVSRTTCLLGPLYVLCLYYFVVNPIMSYIKSNGSYIEFITEEDKYSGNFYTFAFANPDRQILKYGIMRTQIILPLLTSRSIELSEEEQFTIKEGINNHNLFFRNELLLKNKDKNVVFILLESFLSVTSDLVVDGMEITPTLNRLKHRPNTFYNGNITQNTATGESIDGQIIYWTGLLPLESDITLSKIIGKNIECFPKMLKEKFNFQTNIILPTKKNFWRQNELDLVFGIDSEYEAITNDPISNYVGTDAMVFKKASTIEHDLDNKFFDIVVSVSTHSPYDERKPEVEALNINYPNSYSREFCNYLETCHYTDLQIGYYIEWLKESGLFENTIIIIASDHEAHQYGLNMPAELMNNYYLPLYIVNASIGDYDLYLEKANQIDVYRHC